MTRPRFVGGLALVLVVPLVAGCGTPQGKVSGRVLFHEEPLPGGRLTFRPADPRQNAVSVVIGPDGRYEATLPAGDVTICVDNRELQPTARRSGETPLPPGVKLPQADGPAAVPPANPTLPGKYVPIPEKYYDADTSGLRHTVKPGDDSHDIELK
jgi:hypothetical protein